MLKKTIMAKKYKNPSQFRLDFIKENTFNRVWSLRMTRTKVWVVTSAVVAAFIALIYVILAFTPMRNLLPGTLRGDLRSQYIDTALKLDSLEYALRINEAYLTNIVDIMTDNLPTDSARNLAAEKLMTSDSILAASDAERLFVQNYREEERFNLSVLAPLAAEGMIFTTPVATVATMTPEADGAGISISTGRALPVTSVYRGTVIAVDALPSGLYNIVVQHPNDFTSVYGGLGETFVAKGKKVIAGQAVGQSSGKGNFTFDLWHNGTALDPREYIPFGDGNKAAN